MFNEIAVVLPQDKIDWHSYFFSIALVVSARSDCTRRQFGCVAVSPAKRILATGYNSPPEGVLSAVQRYKANHGCNPPDDFHCCKSKDAPKNQAYDTCNALHAEHNCLMELGTRNHYPFVDLYLVGRCGKTGGVVDSSPCIMCSRTIRNFNVRAVHCLQEDGSVVTLNPSGLKITACQ